MTGIDVRGGEIAAVRTTQGTVRTSTVVCAAGAWSREIGAMAGVELDVTPVRRQIALTAPTPVSTPDLPFTIDFSSTFYFHGADDGLLLGMSDPTEVPGLDTTYAPSWEPALREAAGRCAPALADLPITHGWAGLYEVTPDASALIGESRDVGRFLYATGFAGHGFCQAPPPARSSPTSSAAASRSSTSRRCAPSASPSARTSPRSTSSEETR